MSFKEIAERPLVQSHFAREHWCRASYVQDRIKELEEAHEAELKELRESFKKEMDKQFNERMKDSVRLFSAVQTVNSMAASLMNLVDPRNEIAKIVRHKDSEDYKTLMRACYDGVMDGILSGDDLKALLAHCEKDADGKGE